MTTIFLHKHCPDHGFEKVLISTDVEYCKALASHPAKPRANARRFNTHAFDCRPIADFVQATAQLPCPREDHR